jgi:FKBP-type peptidyl-prolyl cis-trans isomerase
MKLPSLLKIILLSLGFATTMSAQEVTLNLPDNEPKTPAALAAQPAENFSEAQILETFGWFVTMRLGMHELEFTPAQIVHFAKGVALAAGGNEAPHSLELVGPKMNDFIQARQDAVIQRFREENEREAREFFTKLKAQPNVKELPSGLRYEILAAGSAEKPKVTDTVTIRYTGSLVDGTVFDSTEGRETPAEISLQDVIPGWTEGVQLIGKGGKIKLYIPAHLAYGDTGVGEIPPGAALVFEVELIDFEPTPPPATEAK